MTDKGWRGYVFSREIAGRGVPQRVQNLVIRTCAERHGLVYLLSATEYYMDGCFMILNSVLEELNEVAGIIFYSTHQLPPEAPERARIYEQVLAAGCGIRFALEDLALLGREDIRRLEDLILCQDLSARAHPGPYQTWLDQGA